MAYVEVSDWNPDQVSEWLKGLDLVIIPYIHYFLNNQVDGKRLLQLTPDELPSLHITKIGHQEIILQGVELLRNIHYHLDQENVQYLALRLSSKARSIYNELRIPTSRNGGGGSAGEDEDGDDDDSRMDGGGREGKKKQERVSTAIIAGVADVLSSVKGLVSWLNRQPFAGVEQYDCLKNDLVELSIRLATIAQRDMFAENQATVILEACEKLAQISDKIIQEYNDPLIIQPASLDIATIKKKADDEWGVMLHGSYHGIHQVSGVLNLSPAHQCGKLEVGDELVQVNYQTVVGWNTNKVLAVMQESPTEVILTIKKRPRHVNTVTQIYFKPFRLPSKKRTYSPWATVGASTRYDLPSIPDLQLSMSVGKGPLRLKMEPEPRPKSLTPPPSMTTPSPQNISSTSDLPNTTSESESDESELEGDDVFLSDGEYSGSPPLSVRLYHPKPRAPVQRRATIPGATTRPTFSIDQLLQDVRLIKGGLRGNPEFSMPSDPDLLRGSSGNDHKMTRPHTCIGTEDKRDIRQNSLDETLKEDRAEESEKEKSRVDDVGNENGTIDTIVKRNSNDWGVSEQSDAKISLGKATYSGGSPGEKRVVNVIPLPPRKPTSLSASVGQDLANAGSCHISVEKNEQCKDHAPSPLLPPQAATKEKESKLGAERVSEVASRTRHISDHRPKLDKSHSTPAYDLNDDGSTTAVYPTTITESSPADHGSPSSTSSSSSSSSSTSTNSSSLKFFGTCDPKSALMPPSVPQQGSCSARNSSTEAPARVTAVSPANANHGEGVKKHFRSQVIIPVVVAGCDAQGGSCVDVLESGAGQRPDSASEGTREEQLHGTVVGDGSSGNASRKFSTSSAGSENAKMPQAVQPTVTSPSSHLPSTSTTAVVLRETRSSSPSVWRRGLLVTDQGSRRISCRDLGQGDHQGWLYRRRDNKGFLLSHRWERRWFILKKNYLYGYRDREAVRADSLVYLPGFHVCPASDVKSKKFAFKIYHSSGATFYFACDTSEERSRWMSQMGLSAISSIATHLRQQAAQQQNNWEEVYYSETDEELEDRTSPSRHSPQSSRSRVSSNQESVGSLWRGSSASPSRGPQTRVSQMASLSSGKNPALRFLQPARDSNQPVPTASFRSYRRVSESSSRSTSTGDLRGPARLSDPPSKCPTEGKGSHTSVTRKNSLRDRLRQIPASFTLERRKFSTSRGPTANQDKPKGQNKVQPAPQADHSYGNTEIVHLGEAFKSKELENSPRPVFLPLSDHLVNDEPSSEENSIPGNSSRPHYMLPTCASSQHMPLRPSSVDLDTRNSPSRVGNGHWCGSPPSSGRCSPTKVEHSSRRGSVDGESPVRSRSPRRGSLDCLASSHSRALSPPMSPLNTSTRSSQGSASSLLASEEYREGSPEKLWINSLRSDSTKQRSNTRSTPEKKDGRSRSASGETSMSERLKRTALYHPPQLRNRGDSMKAAFELTLDPSTVMTHVMVESKDKSHVSVSFSSPQGNGQNEPQVYNKNARKTHAKESGSRTSTARVRSVSRPEVPPRTKFLSPSERTLPISTSLSGSSPVITSRASSLSPSPSNVSLSSTKSTSSLPGMLSASHSRPAVSPSSVSFEEASGHTLNRSYPKSVAGLNITILPEETESVRTPLKPAMGVSMIGKQRRTPAMMSPRDVFFASPPASPTVPFQSNMAAMVSPSVPGASAVSSHPGTVNTQGRVSRNQKILPHYPGMEYPPVFEPGSYSLCGSPPEQASATYQNPADIKLGYSSSESNSFSAIHSNFATSDSSLDLESGNSSSDVQPLQADTPIREIKPQRSSSMFNALSSSLHHNFHMLNSSGSRSPQNVYVSSPVGSRSHQNLYVTSPGYSTSNQNVYVSSPTARSSSHQNIYVTSPVASSHPVHSSAATQSLYSTTQIIQLSGSDSSSVEGLERHRPLNSFPAIEEKPNENNSNSPRSRGRITSPRPQGSPRLHLPEPPDYPPSDEDPSNS